MIKSFYSPGELKTLGFLEIGEEVLISRKVSIYGAHKMRLKSHVRIDDFCILSGNITIGNYVHIAAYSALYGDMCGIFIGDFVNVSSKNTIYAVTDDYSGNALPGPMIPEDMKQREVAPVYIEKHVIIGSGCVLLPGCYIESGVAIGALSLVKSRIEAFTIAAGIPAKKIGIRSKTILNLEKELCERMSVENEV